MCDGAWHSVVPCDHLLLLLRSLLFRRGKTQVLLPWGSWEADRGKARGEGEMEVLAGGTTCLPGHWEAQTPGSGVASWGEQRK